MRYLSIVVLVGLLAPSAALADKKASAEAKDLYDQGKRAYNLGDFDKAIEAWKAGYDKKDDPIFLFNIGQAYRQLKNYDRAVFFFKSYLREDPGAENRSTVEARIAEMQAIIDAGASSTTKPPGEPLGPGEKPTVGPDGKATPATPGEPIVVEPPTPGRTLKLAGLGTGGAGVLLLGTGVYFALQASSIQGELEALRTNGEPWSPAMADKEASGRSAATVAKLTIGFGAAAVIGGGALYYLGMKKARAARVESAWILLPAAGRASAGLVVVGTF